MVGFSERGRQTREANGLNRSKTRSYTCMKTSWWSPLFCTLTRNFNFKEKLFKTHLSVGANSSNLNLNQTVKLMTWRGLFLSCISTRIPGNAQGSSIDFFISVLTSFLLKFPWKSSHQMDNGFQTLLGPRCMPRITQDLQEAFVFADCIFQYLPYQTVKLRKALVTTHLTQQKQQTQQQQ